MDAIDTALLDAWSRLSPAIRANRADALRRGLRRTSRTLSRPIRPWCLCIRASDTRLDRPYATPLQCDAIDLHLPHQLYIPSSTIRSLCAPVDIPWPGIDWTHAAIRLGRHPESLRTWIARGVLHSCKRNARAAGKRGKPVPYVWASRPLDASANHGAPPDIIWGTLWQYMHERIPEDEELVLKRVPNSREYPGDSGSTRHRGWKWLCPGLNGRPCNREASRLFIPLKPWDLMDALGESDPLDLTIPMTDAASRAPHLNSAQSPDQPSIRLSARPPDSNAGLPLPSFQPACHECHRVRYFSLCDSGGWNLFVSHFSRGLLFGHEVTRPHDLEIKRKRRYAARKSAAPCRDAVARLLVEPLTTHQIARRLKTSAENVRSLAAKLYRVRGVHSRRQFIAAVRPDLDPNAIIPRIRSAPRTDQTIPYLLKGCNARQIASALNIRIVTARTRIKALCRYHNVHSRIALIHALRASQQSALSGRPALRLTG